MRKYWVVSEDRVKGFQRDPWAFIARETGLEVDEIMARIRAMLKPAPFAGCGKPCWRPTSAQGALVAWEVPEDKLESTFEFMFQHDPLPATWCCAPRIPDRPAPVQTLDHAQSAPGLFYRAPCGLSQIQMRRPQVLPVAGAQGVRRWAWGTCAAAISSPAAAPKCRPNRRMSPSPR